jgi:hypothetical protein
VELAERGEGEERRWERERKGGRGRTENDISDSSRARN